MKKILLVSSRNDRFPLCDTTRFTLIGRLQTVDFNNFSTNQLEDILAMIKMMEEQNAPKTDKKTASSDS